MTARYQLIAAGGVFDHQTRTNIPPARSNPAWIQYQEWLTAGGVPLPADDAGQLPLAEAIARRVEDINAWSAGLRNKAVAGRSAGEMASWSIKLAEGRAWLASDNPTDAPTLAAIATIRGIPIADLVARVIAQATPFLQAEAAIDGIRGKHCDAIEAMTDVRDVIAYDWQTGWPVIP
jgi:hypothetical protein